MGASSSTVRARAGAAIGSAETRETRETSSEGGVRIDLRGRGGEDDDGKVGIEGLGGEAKGLVVHVALEIFWPKKFGRFQGEGFLASFPRHPPINGLCNSRLCRPRLRPLR